VERDEAVAETYVLLHVVLPGCDSALPELETHLSSRVVDESAEPRPIAGPRLCWSRGIWVAIAICLLLLLGGWRRGGSHHRHGRDMLGNRMVKGGGVCWARCKGLAMHCG
jgi:hypothetical protein